MPQFLETIDWLMPEMDGIDGKDLSKDALNFGRLEADPRRNITLPSRIALALRLLACRTITAEWSTPGDKSF